MRGPLSPHCSNWLGVLRCPLPRSISLPLSHVVGYCPPLAYKQLLALDNEALLDFGGRTCVSSQRGELSDHRQTDPRLVGSRRLYTRVGNILSDRLSRENLHQASSTSSSTLVMLHHVGNDSDLNLAYIFIDRSWLLCKTEILNSYTQPYTTA